MKKISLFSAVLLCAMAVTLGRANAQEYFIQPIDSEHLLQDALNVSGQRSFIYRGNMDENAVLQYYGEPVDYFTIRLYQVNSKAQQFLNEAGYDQWLYVGQQRDRAIFRKVDYPVNYYTVDFSVIPCDQIQQIFNDLGADGYNYLGLMGTAYVFMQVGHPVAAFTTPVYSEWRGMLPQMINELGAGGWKYVGKVKDRIVFTQTGQPIEYMLTPKEVYYTNYQTFFDPYATQGWEYLGVEEGYSIFMKWVNPQ